MEGRFPFIGRKELAERWGVSVSTVDRLANDGEIKRAGFGKFKLSDVEDYEKRNSDRKEKTTETFTERRLKQELAAKDIEITRLRQKLFGIAELAGGYMQDFVKEARV